MFAFKNQAAVNLVGEHHDVAIADGGGDVANILRFQHASGGIMRRVQDHEPGAVGDQVRQLVGIEPEIFVFTQVQGHRLGAEEMDQRLIDREPRVGIDDLVAFFNQGHESEENGRLAAGHDNDFVS